MKHLQPTKAWQWLPSRADDPAERAPLFIDVARVVHGFEGELDGHFHRCSVNGWRFEGLPWEQM